MRWKVWEDKGGVQANRKIKCLLITMFLPVVCGTQTGIFELEIVVGWSLQEIRAEEGSLTVHMDSLTPFRLPRSFTMCSSMLAS